MTKFMVVQEGQFLIKNTIYLLGGSSLLIPNVCMLYTYIQEYTLYFAIEVGPTHLSAPGLRT